MTISKQIENIDKFLESMENLTNNWHGCCDDTDMNNHLPEDYPFDVSFDEKYQEVKTYFESMKENMKAWEKLIK